MSSTFKTEETVSSEEIFKGKLLHLRRDQVRLPEGDIHIREWIDHPGAAAVVPLLSDGRVVMVRQFRYGPRRTFLEIPAGKFDGANETPEEVAARECEEETGYRPGTLRYLGGLYNAVGYCNEIIHLYMATDLVLTGQSLDDDEFLTVELHEFASIVQKAQKGELQDMKTVSAILMAAAAFGAVAEKA